MARSTLALVAVAVALVVAVAGGIAVTRAPHSEPDQQNAQKSVVDEQQLDRPLLPQSKAAFRNESATTTIAPGIMEQMQTSDAPITQPRRLKNRSEPPYQKPINNSGTGANTAMSNETQAMAEPQWPSNIETSIEAAIAQSGLPITSISPPICSKNICEVELTGLDTNPSTADWLPNLLMKLPIESWGARQASLMTREKYPGVNVNVLHLSNIPPHAQPTKPGN